MTCTVCLETDLMEKSPLLALFGDFDVMSKYSSQKSFLEDKITEIKTTGAFKKEAHTYIQYVVTDKVHS